MDRRKQIYNRTKDSPARKGTKDGFSIVKKRGCTICGSITCDVDHIRSFGASGGDEIESLQALCRVHRIECHKLGLTTFAAKYQNVRNLLLEKGWYFCEFSKKWKKIKSRSDFQASNAMAEAMNRSSLPQQIISERDFKMYYKKIHYSINSKAFCSDGFTGEVPITKKQSEVTCGNCKRLLEHQNKQRGQSENSNRYFSNSALSRN